jgi:TonB family protein
LTVTPPPPELIPPQLEGSLAITYPESAPPIHEPVSVGVSLLVDTDGSVKDVVITRSVGEPFDGAVVAALEHAHFKPALYRGEPVQVRIDFTQVFQPPTVEPAPAPELPEAVLEGTLAAKGTRDVVPDALVVGVIDGHRYAVQADAQGRFSLKVEPGEAHVQVVAQGFKPFNVTEHLAANDRVQVRYLVERASYDPYETVVVTDRKREEVARTTLRGRELAQVAGTFGDPFRVVTTLPGVSQAASLLNYPIVRGTGPGNTGFLLDGTPVPELFHLFAGPAVIHPEFVDRIDFYPGIFPARYGGYTGGIVDGRTRRPEPDEKKLDVDLDLTKAGVFVREPTKVGSFTAAGRYGYPSLILGLLNTTAYFDYWDYQLRYDLGSDPGLTVFAFGSYDVMGQDANEQHVAAKATTQFHRLDLRLTRGEGENRAQAALVVGTDIFGADNSNGYGIAGTLATFSVAPRLEAEHALGAGLHLRAGLDGLVRRVWGPRSIGAEGGSVSIASQTYSGGGFVELPIDLGSRLTLVPGVRADVWLADTAFQRAVDPRFSFRLRLLDFGSGPVVLKGGAGEYHQPPRFYIPVPALEQLALERGLLASTQAGLGLESPLGADADLDLQGYYSDMNPIYLDFAPNPSTGPDPARALVPSAWNPTAPSSSGTVDTKKLIDQLIAERHGRSYGLELIVRRREGAPVFGWISYTLSWTDRRSNGQWVPYDFDRRHVLQLVAGVRLPREWSASTHFMIQSGRPVTTWRGYNAGLTAPFFRVDLRVDKQVVWQSWTLALYVDVANVSLSAEYLDSSTQSGFRYVLPTVGLRAIL